MQSPHTRRVSRWSWSNYRCHGHLAERHLLLEAALNGTRTRGEHPGIPLTARDQAREARAAVEEGAGAIHVHVCDGDGRESLAPHDVARTLDAIRTTCPATPIGISTGAWIVPDLCSRLKFISSWTVLPDLVSVNLHELGATEVMRLLLDKGIGIEAGVWNAPAARLLLDSGLIDRCARISIEPADGSANARANLRQIEEVLRDVSCPRLLHGLGACAWPFVELAALSNYDTRIGFEDTLTLPDGSRAPSNAALVAAARRIVRLHQAPR